jgi:hypothetical protein
MAPSPVAVLPIVSFATIAPRKRDRIGRPRTERNEKIAKGREFEHDAASAVVLIIRAVSITCALARRPCMRDVRAGICGSGCSRQHVDPPNIGALVGFHVKPKCKRIRIIGIEPGRAAFSLQLVEPVADIRLGSRVLPQQRRLALALQRRDATAPQPPDKRGQTGSSRRPRRTDMATGMRRCSCSATGMGCGRVRSAICDSS